MNTLCETSSTREKRRRTESNKHTKCPEVWNSARCPPHLRNPRIQARSRPPRPASSTCAAAHGYWPQPPPSEGEGGPRAPRAELWRRARRAGRPGSNADGAQHVPRRLRRTGRPPLQVRRRSRRCGGGGEVVVAGVMRDFGGKTLSPASAVSQEVVARERPRVRIECRFRGLASKLALGALIRTSHDTTDRSGILSIGFVMKRSAVGSSLRPNLPLAPRKTERDSERPSNFGTRLGGAPSNLRAPRDFDPRTNLVERSLESRRISSPKSFCLQKVVDAQR